MKKKVFAKKVLCMMLAAACVFQATGCGNGGKSASSDNSKDYVYVPEYQTIEGMEDVGSMVMNGDTAYFVSGKYNEETEEYKQEIQSIKIGETQTKVLPIEIPAESYVNNLSVDGEGNLLTVMNTYENEENIYLLKRYSVDGTELMSTDITGLGEGMEYFYVQYVATDGEGNIYVANGEQDIWILDKDGKQKSHLTCENWIISLMALPNGKAAVSYWGNEGDVVLAEIDAASSSFGKNYQNVPEAYSGFKKASDTTILLSSGNSVFEYDITTETSEELLNWINCDINGDNISEVIMLEDGRLLAVSRDYSQDEEKTEFIFLTRKDASEVEQKTTITLGAMYIDSRVKESVINFNKTNEKYRIEVKEYGNDDWEAGMTQLNTEIISGNGPDIIDLSMGNADLYIAKGILEDLTPYVEADLNREDYVESVFNAYSSGDKMYGIVSAFTLMTVIGKTSDVGEEQGWTIDDVMALMESKPEGTELFSYCSKDSILYYMCNMSLDSFINWETGECNFNDGYFEKVLEFANRFPKEVEYNEDDESTPSKIQSGKLLLMEVGLSDIQSYQMYSAMYGEPITFIGFPSNGGNGSYINPMGGLAINAKAEHKDGAWEFLKSFLSEEYQMESVEWDFPVMRSALEAQFEEDMTPEYIELNGEKVEEPKTSWGYDDFNVDIYAAKQEDVDALNTLINNTTQVITNNEEISNIITEEAAAFFEGQKTAKDVADIVQSRVNIYVNENR